MISMDDADIMLAAALNRPSARSALLVWRKRVASINFNDQPERRPPSDRIATAS
jgi:hypothetical protein